MSLQQKLCSCISGIYNYGIIIVHNYKTNKKVKELIMENVTFR
jgi:hypothetical protein